MQKIVHLHMARMNCSGCVRNITRTIEKMPAITVTATDLATKTIQVCYDKDQIAIETITAALSQARYPVVRIEESEQE